MFKNRDNHRERKLQICERIRVRAERNRRPIADVIELKLEEYVRVTSQALKDRDADTYRPLLAWSLFQVDR